MDTIVTLSTPLQESAIAIVRLSGTDAIEIVNKIFTKDLTNVASHTVHYGFIKSKEDLIDEVLVTVFRAPKTYTREDVVEISCHGSTYSTKKIIELCVSKGARLAERGEFTKRAFLNGRIDLTQAEAIVDVIEAKNELSNKIAMQGLKKEVYRLVSELKEEIIQILANIEVNIDYPEYDDVEMLTNETLLPRAYSYVKKIDKILKEASKRKLVKEGIKTAIIGRVNVGKSSLLNALLEEEKAIVTNIAGTTRDIVEGYLQLNNITLHLVDTAGIRDTDDVVEQIGIEKSRKIVREADLVLLVIDGSQEIEKEDYELMELVKDKPHLIVINKSDLEQKVQGLEGIRISAINNDVRSLENKIMELFELDAIDINNEVWITSTRHLGLLEKSKENVLSAIDTLESQMSIDLAVVDLNEAWSNLKEILGEEAKTDLLDELFSRFCLGK